jgi:folylpolyglutamate synthase/dihydropteroate synthase
MLATLAPVVSAFIVTRAPNPRAADPFELAAHASRVAPDIPIVIEATAAAALASAWRLAPRIVVAGSIFLIGEVMNELGIS